jgi:hypothetical protein
VECVIAIKENAEKENNGYVVFTGTIHGPAGKWGVDEGSTARPHPFSRAGFWTDI